MTAPQSLAAGGAASGHDRLRQATETRRDSGAREIATGSFPAIYGECHRFATWHSHCSVAVRQRPHSEPVVSTRIKRLMLIATLVTVFSVAWPSVSGAQYH